ncbi:MAG: hypothetical protein HYS13_17315 [Planctomycetia bacterium]|nr:hypothetical protein [Planctomycetia bacterium]
MTPVLSDEQRQAIAEGHGAPVFVLDTLSQSQYVLLPAAAYQRIRSLFGGDDPFDISETYVIQDEAADKAWSHPEDAAYDDYDAHRQQP